MTQTSCYVYIIICMVYYMKAPEKFYFMLNAADSDEVNMELSTPTKAGLIKPSDKDDNEELLMLVMPLMLNQ